MGDCYVDSPTFSILVPSSNGTQIGAYKSAMMRLGLIQYVSIHIDIPLDSFGNSDYRAFRTFSKVLLLLTLPPAIIIPVDYKYCP